MHLVHFLLNRLLDYSATQNRERGRRNETIKGLLATSNRAEAKVNPRKVSELVK